MCARISDRPPKMLHCKDAIGYYCLNSLRASKQAALDSSPRANGRNDAHDSFSAGGQRKTPTWKNYYPLLPRSCPSLSPRETRLCIISSLASHHLLGRHHFSRPLTCTHPQGPWKKQPLAPARLWRYLGFSVSTIGSDCLSSLSTGVAAISSSLDAPSGSPPVSPRSPRLSSSAPWALVTCEMPLHQWIGVSPIAATLLMNCSLTMSFTSISMVLRFLALRYDD